MTKSSPENLARERVGWELEPDRALHAPCEMRHQLVHGIRFLREQNLENNPLL